MSEAMREALVQVRQDARSEVFSILDMLARVATASPHWGEEGRKCAAHIAETVREHFQHSVAADVDRLTVERVAAALALPASPLIEDEMLIQKLRRRWPEDNKMRWGFVNPDGPEAADRIAALSVGTGR